MKRRNFLQFSLALLGLPFLPKIAAKAPLPPLNPYDPFCGAGEKILMPVGYIPPPFTGPLPEGFLPADGRAVSRLKYNELFNALGTTYGEGDGLTTFHVPDLTGRVYGIKDPGHQHGNQLFAQYIIKAR